MQCNVECRLPEEDLISKDPPPMRTPPQRGGAGGLSHPTWYAPKNDLDKMIKIVINNEPNLIPLNILCIKIYLLFLIVNIINIPL